MVKKIEDLDYSLKQVVENRFLKVRTPAAVIQILMEDKEKKNILKPVIMGKGRSKRYYFPGENLRLFLKKK